MTIKANKSGGANYKTGYTDIQDHGVIGNCRTAALVSISGTIAQLCLPHFDSPSVFARILDKNHGGHFSITTRNETQSKQMYLPSTNILCTKFLSEEGIGQISDYMPLPASKSSPHQFLPWLVRKVEVLRGELTFHVECAPAFDYARASHETELHNGDDRVNSWASFTCPQHVDLDLRWTSADSRAQDKPQVVLDTLDLSVRGHKGLGVTTEFTLREGQSVTFVLRQPPEPTTSGAGPEKAGITQHRSLPENAARSAEDPPLTNELLEFLLGDTQSYWLNWIKKCNYTGRWREFVIRSVLVIKLLTFAPTGAIIAAPTFSLPEDLHGAGRNWDYRYAWLRDSAFSVYALLRVGLTEEADQYIEWLSGLLRNSNPDGSLQIMYTIHGGKDIPEIELDHLDGHKGQKPVRIGNGAADHLQLDIYGELLDSLYLAQKLSRPLSYETWVAVRELVDFVCTAWDQPDLSIWEVRGEKQDFLYSKVMCWVAIDRGIRLSEKRSLPAPNRARWLETRDRIYEEIQTKGFNKELGIFSQSYQNRDVLDSSILIMPLVFFCPASEPRFLSTLDLILQPRDRGGLTENNLAYRYDTDKVDDGIRGADGSKGEEGSFTMCTLWLIEALARASAYDKKRLPHAVQMLEDFIGYSNHLGLLSEEISKGGESLGNFCQGFSHVGAVSTIFNVNRALSGHRPWN